MFGQEAWNLCQPLLLLLTTAVLNQNTSSASEDQTHTIQSSKPEDQIDETQQYSVWRSNPCYTPALLLEIKSTAPNSTMSGEQIHGTHQLCAWISKLYHPQALNMKSKFTSPNRTVPGYQIHTTHQQWQLIPFSHVFSLPGLIYILRM